MKKKEWEGVVFHSSLEGGKSGCKIWIQDLKLFGKTYNHQEFSLDIHKMQIHWGGTSQSLLLFEPHPPTKEPTFSVRDKSIIKILREYVRDGHLREQLEGLILKNRMKMAWMLTSLFIFGVMVAAFLLIFLNYGVQWATDMVPYSVDKTIGESAFESSIRQVTGSINECKSPAINKGIREMVTRLTGALEKNPFDYEVKVVRSPITNAFALPGGKIAVLTGLVKKADNPEEVAGVLAHEISHASRRHGVQMLVQRVGLMLLISAVLGGDASALTESIVNNSAKLVGLKFSRDMERDADYYGFLLLKRAKVNPVGLKTFFQKLEKLEAEKGMNSVAIGWISTHPLTSERVERIDGWLQELGDFKAQPFNMDWQEIQKEIK